MKALSLRQPWAWLMAAGLKDIENRNWRSDFRGPCLIHQSKTWDMGAFQTIYRIVPEFVKIGGLAFQKKQLATGAIVGRFIIIDCVTESSSKWFFGKYGYVVKDAVLFDKPIPYRGQLGFFDIPDSILPSGYRLAKEV